MRPKVSFNSRDIWRRLQTCQTVAQAYGWHSNDITRFTNQVRQAFSYEEAMAIIELHFDSRGSEVDADPMPLLLDPTVYRQEADRLRRQADAPENEPVRDEILRIAQQFDQLVESVEPLRAWRAGPTAHRRGTAR
jgi:hypothetical protein